MNKMLKYVLLIDDDEPTNYFNELIIGEQQCAENIISVQNGQAALDLLKNNGKNPHPTPELIFLDINMPAMSGWEFLENYQNLKQENRAKVVIVMLTTSLNPDDRKRAETIDVIDDFYQKPLTAEVLQAILEKHFC